jgi:hypothetical protein
MDEKRKLTLIWTTGDPLTAEHMVLMYATNAMLNRWWDEVTVVLWGAAQKLAAENEAVRLKMEVAEKAGVRFSACISCAVNIRTREDLEAMGVETVRWGARLTELLQSGQPVLTV